MQALFKAALRYLLLVGPPLAGLIAVLQLGQHLAAPPSIGGRWRIDWGAAGSALGCAGLRFSRRPGLTVWQSGPQARLTFSDRAHTTLAVRLDRGALKGVGRAAGPAECAGPLTLEARLTQDDEADHLDGTLGRPGCPKCPPAPFHAERPAAPTGD